MLVERLEVIDVLGTDEWEDGVNTGVKNDDECAVCKGVTTGVSSEDFENPSGLVVLCADRVEEFEDEKSLEDEGPAGAPLAVMVLVVDSVVEVDVEVVDRRCIYIRRECIAFRGSGL